MATIVLGTSWGDEGKGKLIDVLLHTSKTPFRLCARCAGGDNAGHTIEINGKTHDVHILPSGVLSPSTINLIGAGCVLHVPGFFKEMERLESDGLDARGRILISSRAHVVFRLHQILDGLEERALGKGNIGTTKRGIGPTYATKMTRSGVRVKDVFNKEDMDRRLQLLAGNAKRLHGDLSEYNVEDEIKEMDGFRERVRPFVVDQMPLVQDLEKKNEPILVEGANALMLDVDYGTYPYVTSSSTGLAGVFSGLGLSPFKINEVIGVVKAYTTRVGSGPFPTEHTDALGQKLQKEGREFGATTGRARRCGPLDIPMLRYSAAVNHYTVLNLTKLDVLDTFSEIKVAVAYKLQGKEVPFPDNVDDLDKVEVVYETLPGWERSIRGVGCWEDLPAEARGFVEFLEGRVGVKVKWIGTGPGRDSMIVR